MNEHDNGTPNDATPTPPTWQPGASIPTEPTPKKRGIRAWVVVLSVAVVLAVAIGVTLVLVSNHRDEVAAQERREVAAQKAADEAAAKKAAEEKAAAELAAAEETFAACTSELGPMQKALDNATARLSVGLSLQQLSDQIGRASVAHSRIDIEALGAGACLSAGAQLEKAFNFYAKSVKEWNDCVFDYGCDNDSITPSLQAKWAKATVALDRAQEHLDSLDPNSPTYDAEAADSTL